MFYFHGQKGGNFAVVSDDKLQINAHFIGSRPQGRRRDYTWVQALSVMFDTHTLVLGAKRVSHWDDNVDSLLVKWDGEEISVPTTGDAEWRVDSGERQVVVERTGDANSVRVMVTGLVQMDVKVILEMMLTCFEFLLGFLLFNQNLNKKRQNTASRQQLVVNSHRLTDISYFYFFCLIHVHASFNVLFVSNLSI